MGVFSVEIKMTNLFDRFRPESEQGSDVECEALVDSGAAELALPAEIVETLKLEPLDTINVVTADGGQHEYRVCGMVELEVHSRRCHVRAIETPRGTKPLLGAIPLEETDWHISPMEKKLLPNPKSPEKPLIPLC